jgi:hypothetical protein
MCLLSGCALKYTHNSMDDQWFDSRVKRGWRPSLAASVTTDNIGIGFSAISLSFDAASQDFDVDAVPPLVDFESVGISSFSLSARFFPVNRGPLLPYVGAGYGLSRLRGTWTGPNYDVQRYDCIGACEGTYKETFYSGYHPHLVGGVELRFRPSTALVVEYRKDIDRGDDFWLLDGHGYSVGLRWLPRW